MDNQYKKSRSDFQGNGYNPTVNLSAPVSPFPFAVKVTDHSELNSIRNNVIRLVGTDNKSFHSLPGPLPHTVTRANLSSLMNADYWVCEKSDGQRVMLFVDCGFAYILDRKFDAFRINDPHNLFQSLTTAGPTLVDGELITNYFDPERDVSADKSRPVDVARDTHTVTEWIALQKNPRFTMCIFDVIQVNGENCAHEMLLNRLKGVGDMKSRLQEAAKASNLDLLKEDVLPVIFQSKRFTKAYRCREIYSKISELHKGSHHYVYFDEEKGIKSLNDGVIFTPENNNYLHKFSNSPIFKFKWAGLHTVDFLLRKPFFDDNGFLKLYTDATALDSGRPGGNSGKTTVMCRSTDMDTLEKEQLLRDIGTRQQVVAEFAYDNTCGRWKVKLIRDDKKSPNFITTVFSCLEAMADNLTVKEVEGLLLKKKQG